MTYKASGECYGETLFRGESLLPVSVGIDETCFVPRSPNGGLIRARSDLHRRFVDRLRVDPDLIYP